MERLQRSQFFKTYPDDEDLLEDVITENQRMNVALPLQDWPYTSWLILTASVGTALLVARIFMKRDWM